MTDPLRDALAEALASLSDCGPGCTHEGIEWHAMQGSDLADAILAHPAVLAALDRSGPPRVREGDANARLPYFDVATLVGGGDRSGPAEGLREAMTCAVCGFSGVLMHRCETGWVAATPTASPTAGGLDERAVIERNARFQDALDALTSEPFASPHIWRSKARSGAVAVRRALAATPAASPTEDSHD